MSSPENSEEASGVPTKESLVEGFSAIAEAHRNIALHLDSYAKWIESADLPDSALQVQIELIKTLHQNLQ